MSRRSRILLAGATGYIGGRQLVALEATGRPIRLAYASTMISDPARQPSFTLAGSTAV